MSSETCWGTWTPARPAELSHLPTGFTITPVLYSARANSASAVAPGEIIRFGPRSLDQSNITFETRHEDTQLHWQYKLSDLSTIDMSWRCIAHGEWGLRYWVNLCFSAPAGSGFRFDRATGVLSSDNATGQTLSVIAARQPLMATFHDDLPALLREYADKGYFYLGSRGTSGTFAVLRFNLEEAPTMTCRAILDVPGTHTSHMPPTIARTASRSSGSLVADPDEHCGCSTQLALEAVHDVVAWNHVYDSINARSYTVLTRFWNQQKFGGFGIWMNDVMYHALLWSRYDAEKAQRNIEAVFTWQTSAGNFPCLVTGNDAWLDRSQPPIVSYVVWCCYQVALDVDLLRWAFPRLLANHDWWWRRRSLHDTGLVAYGTSLDAGDGLYKGTKLAAKDESSMDNMAVHDPAEFDASTGLIQAADVGLNSMLALDGEILVQMATMLKLETEANRLEQQNKAHKACIADWLWDETRGIFANRLVNGQFVQPLAPTSFFPMAAGIASDDQVDSLIKRYLLPEEKFGGRFVLPSATRDDPAYQDNVYWRGRIWAPLNYWVYEGLRRYRRSDEASELAHKSFSLFNQGWQDRYCGENYHAESGAIRDQPDTDYFYTWGAMLPVLSVKEVIDDTPWHGLSLAPSRAGEEFGPIASAWGSLTIYNGRTQWAIVCEGEELLCGTVTSRLSHIKFSVTEFIADIVASQTQQTLSFPKRRIIKATLDACELLSSADTVTLAAGHDAGQLVVSFDTGL
ncbi:MAG: trehalase family glycosidase [Granulosicoccus sp.]